MRYPQSTLVCQLVMFVTVKVLFRLQKLVKDLIIVTPKTLTLLEENRQYTLRNSIYKKGLDK